MRPTMSYRAYRKKMSRRSKSLCNKPLAKEQMNSTLVKSIGRTNPYALAEALDLYPGRPFRWEQWRWDKVARSGLFAEVEKRVTKIEEANVSNVGQPGKVRLDILAREAPCRTLDYGVTKSLYTGKNEDKCKHVCFHIIFIFKNCAACTWRSVLALF
mmetsp:Transcript_5607/g.11687  ORF Transcript_5607/g.11687 Transcript_5607/m.11687 type:complete len:157 (+) Transcript_5607:921-1391(+)